MLPTELVDSLKISPNNMSYYSGDDNRNYPPNCIITGILFLNCLMCKYNTILDEKLEQDLKNEKIDTSIFKLPVEKK